MMENSTNNTHPTEEKIGRRQLLKALAATSGAVLAASTIPTEWVKPVIESGVLPAHAQGSPAGSSPTLNVIQTESDLYVYRLVQPNGSTITLPTNGTVTYSGDSGTYIIQAQYTGPQPTPDPDPRPFIRLTVDGQTITAGPTTFLNDGNYNEAGRFSL